MLIIIKVFIIPCLLSLCGNRVYPDSFQNKALLSNECPSEVRGNVFLKWASINLSSKLSLTYGSNVKYYKSIHHPIPTLPMGNGTPWKFSKQVSKLPFQLSFQTYSLLDQTEGEREALFGRVKQRGPDYEIIPKSTWLI